MKAEVLLVDVQMQGPGLSHIDIFLLEVGS
jgi:hypothetical protein